MDIIDNNNIEEILRVAYYNCVADGVLFQGGFDDFVYRSQCWKVEKFVLVDVDDVGFVVVNLIETLPSSEFFSDQKCVVCVDNGEIRFQSTTTEQYYKYNNNKISIKRCCNEFERELVAGDNIWLEFLRRSL